MEFIEDPFGHITPLPSARRGNVRVPNPQMPDAIPYVPERGCK